MNSFEKNYHL